MTTAVVLRHYAIVLTSIGRGIAHVAAFLLGVVIAWFLVGEAWIRFDSVLLMWFATALCLGAGIGFVAWRRSLASLSAGAVMSALSVVQHSRSSRSDRRS